MRTKSQSRHATGLYTRLVPLLALLAVLLVIEAIVVPLGVFVPAEFRDRHTTLFELFEPDPVLGFRARPNLRDFEVRWMGNSLRASYDTDAHGFRNAGRNYAQSEIVFVGDSFTWGSWVPREETFPDVAGQRLRIPVLNLAQESYYIEQYEKVIHLLLENWVTDRRPRYVAVCIFANDLTTPISDDDLSHFYERFGWNEYREYPLYQKFFVYRAGRFAADSARWLAVRAGLADPAAPSQLDRKTTPAGIELYRQLGAHPYYFSESYNLHTEKVFRRLLRYIADQNITPLVFLLPSKESAYKDEYQDLFPGDYFGIEEMGYQRLCEIASELEVPCADLTAAFRAATKTTVPYFQRDPHWNQLGHEVAAAEVVRIVGMHPTARSSLPADRASSPDSPPAQQ